MTADVITQRQAGVGIITLNRPQALNALNLSMLRTIHNALTEWQRDSTITAVVLRGNGRAFCAGGDIKAVAIERENPIFLDQVYRIEYYVDRLIHEFRRPVIALMHGATMGGGCGLSLHASHPVVAEDLVLAMPETAIGFFPDIAGSVFLRRCPDNVGLYMALTGARIGAAEAIRLGLAKAIVPLDRHEALIELIAEGADVDQSIEDLSIPQLAQGIAIDHRDHIKTIFSGNSAIEIVSRLRTNTCPWAVKTLENLASQCPFSLEVTARIYDRSGNLPVAEALACDFRVARRMTLRHDYIEGVRARLIDRAPNPLWQPRTLEEVSLEQVGACFAPLDGPELW